MRLEILQHILEINNSMFLYLFEILTEWFLQRRAKKF